MTTTVITEKPIELSVYRDSLENVWLRFRDEPIFDEEILLEPDEVKRLIEALEQEN